MNQDSPNLSPQPAPGLPRQSAVAGIAAGVALVSAPSLAAAQSDPFAAQGAPPASASAAPGPIPGGGTEVAVAPPKIGCEHITSALCAKQNNAMLALEGGYVAACVFIAALLRAMFNKRATGSNAFRFLFPMLLAAGGAGTLTALDPARGADLACCLGSSTFRAQILLQDSTIGRALLFGALPAAILFTVVVFIIAKVRK